MTRTKNRVFFIAPEKNPSEFLLELKHDYKNVMLCGNWNEGEVSSMPKKVCPLCGYPMQLKYKKAYGLRLYICSNEPELCGFMTNENFVYRNVVNAMMDILLLNLEKTKIFC